MLLGVIIALIGVGFAQPGNNAFLFRTLIFISFDVLNILPIISIILILIGSVIGIIGYFQKGQD